MNWFAVSGDGSVDSSDWLDCVSGKAVWQLTFSQLYMHNKNNQ